MAIFIVMLILFSPVAGVSVSDEKRILFSPSRESIFPTSPQKRIRSISICHNFQKKSLNMYYVPIKSYMKFLMPHATYYSALTAMDKYKKVHI